ncbi:MAG: hypothetical protein ACF8R7_13505 [Phycisphaerales bacterium JB039]
MMRSIAAAAIACACLAAPAPAQDLTAETFDKWAEYIRPAPAECSWEEIRWLESLGKGIAAGAKDRKPVLLWAMNGHPQGCT